MKHTSFKQIRSAGRGPFEINLQKTRQGKKKKKTVINTKITGETQPSSSIVCGGRGSVEDFLYSSSDEISRSGFAHHRRNILAGETSCSARGEAMTNQHTMNMEGSCFGVSNVLGLALVVGGGKISAGNRGGG